MRTVDRGIRCDMLRSRDGKLVGLGLVARGADSDEGKEVLEILDRYTETRGGNMRVDLNRQELVVEERTYGVGDNASEVQELIVFPMNRYPAQTGIRFYEPEGRDGDMVGFCFIEVESELEIKARETGSVSL